MYKSLAAYLRRLEHEGELVRIGVPVDPVLEIAEITDRESKRPGGGRALLFEQSGTPFPVVTNMLGSPRRMAMALGAETLDEFPERIEGLFDSLASPKPTLNSKLKMIPLLAGISRWLPRNRRGRGVCQEVILTGAEADLGELPVLQCWPYDGGRFVTLPLVHTMDPETGIRNVGMYRMQLFSGRETGMHWHLHKTGERHYRAYARLGKRMPVTVCLGGDPAYTYAATAPLPDNVDEYLLAGFLRRRPVKLVRCLTNELTVPEDCDFVIEGYVDPAEEKAIEGPFGDHTGFYSLEDRYPIFHVTAITHRRNAIYPATLVGIPPQEDAAIAAATEKIFLTPIRRTMLPEVRDLHMPVEGTAHNLAIVDIEATYPGQGLKVASSLWGAGQMMFNKFLVVTSGGTDIRDPAALMRLVSRIDPARDVMVSRGPLDVLDHAAPEPGFGGKMVFDTTRILTGDAPETLKLPPRFGTDRGIASVDGSLAGTWRTLILKSSLRQDLTDFEIPRYIRGQGVEGIRFVLLLDEGVDTSRPADALWLAAANCDPSRDVEIAGELIVFDGRSKAGGINGFHRRWPNVTASSPETIEQVDRRWPEYGLGEFTSSPSEHYRALQPNRGASVDG